MNCKNCKFWKRLEKSEVAPSADCRFGRCSSVKFIYECDAPHSQFAGDADVLLYEDYEGWSADFVTGEDFGCIHYSGEENEKH